MTNKEAIDMEKGHSVNVKIAYDEMGLLLNENNLFYWNRLNDNGKKDLVQDLNEYFKQFGIIPSVTELNITFRFMLSIVRACVTYEEHKKWTRRRIKDDENDKDN